MRDDLHSYADTVCEMYSVWTPPARVIVDVCSCDVFSFYLCSIYFYGLFLSSCRCSNVLYLGIFIWRAF